MSRTAAYQGQNCSSGSATQQQQQHVTLSGTTTASIIEYLGFAINGILFQRGVYPPECFRAVRKFGVEGLAVSTDAALNDYLAALLQSVATHVARGECRRLVLLITDPFPAAPARGAGNYKRVTGQQQQQQQQQQDEEEEGAGEVVLERWEFRLDLFPAEGDDDDSDEYQRYNRAHGYGGARKLHNNDTTSGGEGEEAQQRERQRQRGEMACVMQQIAECCELLPELRGEDTQRRYPSPDAKGADGGGDGRSLAFDVLLYTTVDAAVSGQHWEKSAPRLLSRADELSLRPVRVVGGPRVHTGVAYV